MELFVKLFQVAGVDQVDKSVAYIALIFQVTRQVQEIVAVFEDRVDFRWEVLDGILVWHIFDHDGGSRVIVYIFDIDVKSHGVISSDFAVQDLAVVVLIKVHVGVLNVGVDIGGAGEGFVGVGLGKTSPNSLILFFFLLGELHGHFFSPAEIYSLFLYFLEDGIGNFPG